MDPTTQANAPTEAHTFFAMIQARMRAGDSSMHYLGATEEAGRAIADLAARTRVSMWNLQRFMTFYALRDGRALTDDSRTRGVSMRLAVGPASLAMCPILSSYVPGLRVAPVIGALMVLDARQIVVAGLDAMSIWTSSDPAVVGGAIRAYEATWSRATPVVPEGTDPPLTPRMVDIAWLLAEGASDRVISRGLGISERTVSAEVREIGRRLGTANRAHTIARICGAPL